MLKAKIEKKLNQKQKPKREREEEEENKSCIMK